MLLFHKIDFSYAQVGHFHNYVKHDNIVTLISRETTWGWMQWQNKCCSP